MEVLRPSIDHRVTKLIQQEAQEQKSISLSSSLSSSEEEEQEEEHFHVLAVDDSLLDRKLLERLLKISSYKVTCVDSGDEALRYLGLVDDDVDRYSNASTSSSSSNLSNSPPQEGSKVNLIMTDYCMPGMSGYDLLKRVKGSLWKDVPVVIMSSENVPSRISKCLEEGAEEFLLKPVKLSDLKNLESYLMKPLVDHYYEAKIMDDINNNNNMCDEDDDLAAENDDKIGVVENKSNNGISKRKAVMSPSPSQSRPNNKVKGLAVM